MLNIIEVKMQCEEEGLLTSIENELLTPEEIMDDVLADMIAEILELKKVVQEYIDNEYSELVDDGDCMECES